MPPGFIIGATLAIGGCFFFANPDLIERIRSPIRCGRSGFVKKAFWLLLTIQFAFLLYWNLFTIAEYSGWDFNDVIIFNSTQTIQYSNVPKDWKNRLHIHIYQYSNRGNNLWGGCMVLWELADSIADLGISISTKEGCPSAVDVAGPIATNKTIIFVYPEVHKKTCKNEYLPNSTLDVRWILAPLWSHNIALNFFKWGEDDLVFNFASSCALYPDLLPKSNILQVITSPKEGDEYDLPAEIFNSTNRQGTAWTLRKGNKWHSNIDYIHKRLPEPTVKMNNLTPDKLQKYEYFVSYDPYTFYSYAAAMSGVVSIVHPIANVTKEEWAFGTYVGEYLKENGGGVPGVAYGWNDEEVLYARRTMPDLRGFMMNVRKWGKEKTVERFARDCYRHGNGERGFESGLLVRDAYSKFYDGEGNLLAHNSTTY